MAHKLTRPALVVIQCRFASTRLPGKALLPLSGVPLLVFLIRRLKKGLSPENFRLVLATTQRPEDNLVAACGEKEGLGVVRGPVDDLLSRFHLCLRQYPAEVVARVTADNPFTCPEILIDSLAELKSRRADYIQSCNHPYGVGVDVYRVPALLKAYREATAAYDREHINNYILQNPDRFKLESLKITGKCARPELRLTVDTVQDYSAIKNLCESIPYEPKWETPLDQAIVQLA